MCCGVRSCRSYVLFHSFTGGGGGKTAIQEYFELFDFSEKCAMEHLSVIFEKGSSKVSSKKKYNEYQKFCTCRRIRYLWSVTLKRLVNDARCRIIHTRPKITSWKKLSGLSNSLVVVRRNGGMAEWRKNCLQILEDGLAEDCPKSLG